MSDIACHHCEEINPRLEEIRTSGVGNRNLYKCGSCKSVVGKGTEKEVLDNMEIVAQSLESKAVHKTLDEYERED